MKISTREYILLTNYRKLSDADKGRIDVIINAFIPSVHCSRRGSLSKCNTAYFKKRLICYSLIKSVLGIANDNEKSTIER